MSMVRESTRGDHQLRAIKMATTTKQQHHGPRSQDDDGSNITSPHLQDGTMETTAMIIS